MSHAEVSSIKAAGVFLLLCFYGCSSAISARPPQSVASDSVAESAPQEALRESPAPAVSIDRELFGEALRHYSRTLVFLSGGNAQEHGEGYADHVDCFYGSPASRQDVLSARAANLENNQAVFLSRAERPTRIVPVDTIGLSAAGDTVVFADFGWVGKHAWAPVTFYSRRIAMQRIDGVWRIVSESNLYSSECGDAVEVRRPSMFSWMQTQWNVLYDVCERGDPGLGESDGCDLAFVMTPELYCQHIGRAEDEECLDRAEDILNDFTNDSTGG